MVAAAAAGAPVRLLAMSGRKNASIRSPHRAVLPHARACDGSGHIASSSVTGSSKIKVALQARCANGRSSEKTILSDDHLAG